jgi:hypothetical protein
MESMESIEGLGQLVAAETAAEQIIYNGKLFTMAQGVV